MLECGLQAVSPSADSDTILVTQLAAGTSLPGPQASRLQRRGFRRRPAHKMRGIYLESPHQLRRSPSFWVTCSSFGQMLFVTFGDGMNLGLVTRVSHSSTLGNIVGHLR